MTNQELGTRLGVSASQASRIRNGRRRCSIEVLVRIHKEFKVPMGMLLDAYVQGPLSLSLVLQEAFAGVWTEEGKDAAHS